MRKMIALMMAAVLVMTTLCGCNILEVGTPPTLPDLGYDESALTGVVEFVNGRTCRISILEGDGHYDGATEKSAADVVFVTYASLSGSQSVQAGDTVTFTYSYTEDVTERDSEPHISVKILTVK